MSDATAAGRPAVLDDLPRLVRCLLALAAASAVGGLATVDSVKTWYPTLDKPGFTPPSWVFGPAWTLLYALMGVADYLVVREGDGPEIRRARGVYRVQLVLNTLWSVLFFGRRSPLAALIEIVGLLIAIVLTIAAFARVSRPAAALLVPYLLWTTFVAALNEEVWRRNHCAATGWPCRSGHMPHDE